MENPWIVGIVSLLSLFGVANIIQQVLTRFWKKRDDAETVHSTNDGKLIDASSHAFTQVLERLRTVESRVNELTDKLAEEMKTNSRLSAENELLKKELERQRDRGHQLASDLQKKDGEILELRNLLHETQLQLAALQAKVEATGG